MHLSGITASVKFVSRVVRRFKWKVQTRRGLALEKHGNPRPSVFLPALPWFDKVTLKGLH